MSAGADLPFVQVDAFADRPFAGNPAAVIATDEALPDPLMADVAMEMNLSETAYLVPQGDGTWSLRWFTPAVEEDLCGHATLASAHVLWEQGLVHDGHEVRFQTRSGTLRAWREPGDARIWLDFPATPPSIAPSPPGLEETLGARPVGVWRSRFDLVVELADASTVERLSPDLGALADIPGRGVIVTAGLPQGADRDFVSRFFAPSAGVPEDPVTGSAHCALAPLWADRLGRDELVGEQLSRRRGTVWVRRRGDRVHLGGTAVTVLSGTIRRPQGSRNA